jgi:hypothetical protein
MSGNGFSFFDEPETLTERNCWPFGVADDGRVGDE